MFSHIASYLSLIGAALYCWFFSSQTKKGEEKRGKTEQFHHYVRDDEDVKRQR